MSARYRAAIEALAADHHQGAGARFAGAPGPIVLMGDARPDGLHQEAHRLAGHGREALHAQHVELLRQRADPRRQRARVRDLGQRHHEAVEVVVVVGPFLVVPGAAVLDIVLAAERQPQQGGGIDPSAARHDDLDGAWQHARDGGHGPVGGGGIEQIALVEHDEIRAGDLILEHFLDRIVVLERAVGGALARQRFEIGGDAAVGERWAVHHRDHAVDRHPVADRRPQEGLHQRLGQRQPGGLDHDVIGLARQEGVERRDEFVGDRAAQTAIGELDDVVLRAGGIAAALEEFAVDPDIAELVDDDGELLALRIGEHMADEGGLAGAQKAGDDRAGHALERSIHV